MWRLAGTYMATCNCKLVCPCPTDNQPNAEGGVCVGQAAMHVREGNLDDTDLSGVTFVLCTSWSSNPSAGNWKLGVLVDEAAPDDKVDALVRVLSGQEGGPFADFSALVGQNLGVERASISFSNGSVTVGGNQLSFEPYVGPDGSPTIVRNAAFGFAPEFKIGRGRGHGEAFGLSFDSSYGEGGDFLFSSEQTEQEIRPRG